MQGQKSFPNTGQNQGRGIILAPLATTKPRYEEVVQIVALPHSVVERRPPLHCVRRPGWNLAPLNYRKPPLQSP
jgi:hypothetical protein